MNKKKRTNNLYANKICGATIPMNSIELKKWGVCNMTNEHYCAKTKGHRGRHKCLYTDCNRTWK